MIIKNDAIFRQKITIQTRPTREFPKADGAFVKWNSPRMKRNKVQYITSKKNRIACLFDLLKSWQLDVSK